MDGTWFPLSVAMLRVAEGNTKEAFEITQDFAERIGIEVVDVDPDTPDGIFLKPLIEYPGWQSFVETGREELEEAKRALRAEIDFDDFFDEYKRRYQDYQADPVAAEDRFIHERVR